MKTFLFALLTLLAALFGSAGQASAQTCTFTVSNMAFGSADLTTGAAVDSTATMAVTCVGLAGRTVRLCPSIGDGTGGSNSLGSPRQLTDGLGNQIAYTFFSDAARTNIWGSWVWPWSASFPGPQFDLALGSTGVASASYTLYGRILASQPTVVPGSFTLSFAGHTLMAYGYSTIGTCPAIGSARNATPSFSVSATNLRNCTLSTTAMNFGTQSVLSSNIDSTASLLVRCSRTVPYTIAMNEGLWGSPTGPVRRMANGANRVTYQLYGNAARTLIWFNGGSTYLGSGTGTGTSQTLTVYGRVPSQTTPPSGVYNDTVVVTVTY